jgi:hypothetical protein
MRVFAFPVFLGVLYSCHSNRNKTENAPDAVIAAVVKAMDTLAVVVEDEIQIDSNFKNFPVNFSDTSTHYPASLLTAGLFHSEEVTKENVGRNWYGLFHNKEGYYLDSTGITTTKIHDGVADDEGQATGWEVQTNNTDTSLLLFAGVDGLSKRTITSAVLSKQEILPGEKESFMYNGIVYTLYATGDKKKETNSDSYIITSYQLFLQVTINGVDRKQLLVSARILDDTTIRILFAGDIDGDTIPDLIINTSWHYNAEAPTLYLSKPAEKNKLLRIMGLHVSTGC